MKRVLTSLLLVLLLLCGAADRAGAAVAPCKNNASGSSEEIPNKRAYFEPLLVVELQRDRELWGYDLGLGVDVGPNLYAYVNQNPWSKFDPLGLELEEPTKREVRDETRESDETHNTMVDRYESTKQNSPAFNKIVDQLKGADGEYRVEMTDRDRSHIGGDTAYISQRAVKESTEKTVEALAEELGHLTQNAGQASTAASSEFANATTAEQRARIMQKGMDAAGLGVFDESDVQASTTDPNYNAREAQAGRISNIVTTEVLSFTAQQGDEPFYSGDAKGGTLFENNPSARVTYDETPNRKSNGNIIPNSMRFQKPFGSYPFTEMQNLWKNRK